MYVCMYVYIYTYIYTHLLMCLFVRRGRPRGVHLLREAEVAELGARLRVQEHVHGPCVMCIYIHTCVYIYIYI